MTPKLLQGRRLTDEDYRRAVVALQSRQPATPTPEQDRTARRAELNLRIDHRLGVDFPAHRREKLWAVQERLEKRMLGLTAWRWLSWLWPDVLENQAQDLARLFVRDHAGVLTPPELEHYFGAQVVKPPALPVEDRGNAGR
jgi:hypothetical protein